jgi:hypothetical protein
LLFDTFVHPHLHRFGSMFASSCIFVHAYFINGFWIRFYEILERNDSQQLFDLMSFWYTFSILLHYRLVSWSLYWFELDFGSLPVDLDSLLQYFWPLRNSFRHSRFPTRILQWLLV